MPFSPSDIPWWGWLLCAVAAGIVYMISSAVYEERQKPGFGISGPVAFLSGAAGAICALVGIIRFVKWVWGG